jgi:transcriptional regulator
MHPNPVYRQASAGDNLAFARARSFGLLSVNGEDGPLLSHVPFLLADDGASADLHLVRSNPITAALTTHLRACLAVSGPDAYISPDWYAMDDQVPTWNYVAVHLRGRLERMPDAALPDLLARQSAALEARLAPKKIWTLDKMPDEALRRHMRMIVPVRLHVDSVDGTWKLAQNKPEAARIGAADNIAGGFGQELGELARLMHRPPA